MQLKVAVDFDGTIADTNALKSAWIRQSLGLNVPPYLCDRTSCVPLIGREAYEAMGLQVYSAEATDRVPPVSGAREALRAIAGRGSAILLTAREGQTFGYAGQWLERHGLRELCTEAASMGERTKAEVARDLGCTHLVDDDARHLMGIEGGGLGCIELKVGAPEGQRPAPGAVLCRSWPEVLRVLGL